MRWPSSPVLRAAPVVAVALGGGVGARGRAAVLPPCLNGEERLSTGLEAARLPGLGRVFGVMGGWGSGDEPAGRALCSCACTARAADKSRSMVGHGDYSMTYTRCMGVLPPCCTTLPVAGVAAAPPWRPAPATAARRMHCLAPRCSAPELRPPSLPRRCHVLPPSKLHAPQPQLRQSRLAAAHLLPADAARASASSLQHCEVSQQSTAAWCIQEKLQLLRPGAHWGKCLTNQVPRVLDVWAVTRCCGGRDLLEGCWLLGADRSPR